MIATCEGQHFLVRGGCVSPYFPNVGVGRVMLGPMVLAHDSLVSLGSVFFWEPVAPKMNSYHNPGGDTILQANRNSK